jgi:hypothetical protein
MASAFWTLEDGRGMARRWTGMAYMLELITHELKNIEGAEAFYEYLETFVYREENGDFPNGYGGFISRDKDIMFNLDLRTFAPQNRLFFWQAAQSALTKLKLENDKENQGIESLLIILLDMNKRYKRGEDPMLLTDFNNIQPEPTEKLGPGW